MSSFRIHLMIFTPKTLHLLTIWSSMSIVQFHLNLFFSFRVHRIRWDENYSWHWCCTFRSFLQNQIQSQSIKYWYSIVFSISWNRIDCSVRELSFLIMHKNCSDYGRFMSVIVGVAACCKVYSAHTKSMSCACVKIKHAHKNVNIRGLRDMPHIVA